MIEGSDEFWFPVTAEAAASGLSRMLSYTSVPLVKLQDGDTTTYCGFGGRRIRSKDGRFSCYMFRRFEMQAMEMNKLSTDEAQAIFMQADTVCEA